MDKKISPLSIKICLLFIFSILFTCFVFHHYFSQYKYVTNQLSKLKIKANTTQTKQSDNILSHLNAHILESKVQGLYLYLTVQDIYPALLDIQELVESNTIALTSITIEVPNKAIQLGLHP